ncbi:hypothetical protein F383_36612 [Gossypium arboreum]|uniref:Uncharacterized protein n=1 Tax=Gossypium arboreum TaxID=29729 RepID=A0A0B0MCZ2_GOSAR|nr:hypothetical protein F383_36612 [Gossypium arboreum]
MMRRLLEASLFRAAVVLAAHGNSSLVA